MLFLDPHTRELYVRWDEEAARAVASLRLVAGRYRDDRELSDLVGELVVHTCMAGMKLFRHPQVGELELEFEALHLPDDSGQRVLTYAAVPGTASEAALRLLVAHGA